MSARDAKERFSDRADAYAAHRPEYPPAVLDALFAGLGPEEKLIVADIGAGTGISTRLLAERVQSVVAIEPNVRMRAHIPPLGNVTPRDGTAEHTGLPDKAVDIAVAFQAFHWFEAADAFHEFQRIARRRIAMVQYERDEAHPFTAAYGAIVRRYATDDTEALRLQKLEAFARLAGEGLRSATVPYTQSLTLEGLIGRAASASYLPKEGADCERMRGEIRDAFRQFEADGNVELSLSVHILASG